MQSHGIFNTELAKLQNEIRRKKMEENQAKKAGGNVKVIKLGKEVELLDVCSDRHENFTKELFGLNRKY
jgi:hypothetical protein